MKGKQSLWWSLDQTTETGQESLIGIGEAKLIHQLIWTKRKAINRDAMWIIQFFWQRGCCRSRVHLSSCDGNLVVFKACIQVTFMLSSRIIEPALSWHVFLSEVKMEDGTLLIFVAVVVMLKRGRLRRRKGGAICAAKPLTNNKKDIFCHLHLLFHRVTQKVLWALAEKLSMWNFDGLLLIICAMGKMKVTQDCRFFSLFLLSSPVFLIEGRDTAKFLFPKIGNFFWKVNQVYLRLLKLLIMLKMQWFFDKM